MSGRVAKHTCCVVATVPETSDLAMHRLNEVHVCILEGVMCTNADMLPKGERKFDAAEVDKAFITKRKIGSVRGSFIHNGQCMTKSL
jgi:hypothetical protein